MLVGGRVVGDRVVAVVTRQAEGVFRPSCRRNHAVETQVAQGIGIEEAANFILGIGGRHQLAALGKVDAVHTGVDVGRAAHQDVYLLGSGLLEGGDPGLAGRAAHDGVIHDHHALAAHQIGNEVEFHPHVEVADELRGLQEASAHVVIAHEGHLEGDAAFQRISQRGAIAGIRDRNDDIGLDFVFPG